MFDFPSSPTTDQIYTSGGVSYKWNGYAWVVQPAASVGVTDGDKGDIVVSGTGTVWMFDSAVVTAAAKTVLDDATVGAMRATLGAEGAITGGTAAQYWNGLKAWATVFDQTAADLRYVEVAGDTMTGVLKIPDGTLAAPAIAFASLPGCGFAIGGADGMMVIGGGAARAYWGPAYAAVYLPFRGSTGTAAAPSYSFTSGTNAGLFLKGAAGVGLSAGGVEAMSWAATTLVTTAAGPIVLPGNPANALEAAPKQYVDLREPALPGGGTTSTWLRGDKTWQALPAGSSFDQAAADLRYVELAGDTMTGDLTIGKTAPNLFLTSPVTNGASTIQFYNATFRRWQIMMQGSLGNMDMVVQRFDAAGTLVDQPIKIDGANGDVTIIDAVLTGNPVAPTPTAGDNDTSIATTAFVTGAIATSAGTKVTSVTGTAPVVSSGGLTPAISIPAATTSVAGHLTAADWTTFNAKAPTASPTFTGTPIVPTAAPGTNTTQAASTAYVLAAVAGVTTSLQDAPPASPINGQFWFETDSGKLFLYWNDGSSSQYVQVGGPVN